MSRPHGHSVQATSTHGTGKAMDTVVLPQFGAASLLGAVDNKPEAPLVPFYSAAPRPATHPAHLLALGLGLLLMALNLEYPDREYFASN